MNLPSKLSETGLGAKEKRKINEIIDYLKSITPRDTPTIAHDRTPTGIMPRAKSQPTTTGGEGYWR